MTFDPVQSMAALRVGNRIRVGKARFRRVLDNDSELGSADRAELKKLVAARLEQRHGQVLGAHRVVELLKAIPGLGVTTADQVCTLADVAPTKRVRELSAYQVERLCWALREANPRLDDLESLRAYDLENLKSQLRAADALIQRLFWDEDLWLRGYSGPREAVNQYMNQYPEAFDNELGLVEESR